MKIKFTKDGKKVKVVGKINSTQYICQEIFVDEDGNEIPLGEKFTETNLIDRPLESWREKKIRELEERYEANKKALDNKLDALRLKMRNQIPLWEKWIKQVGSTFEDFNYDVKDKVTELLHPDYEYVLIGLGRYYSTKIIKKEKWIMENLGCDRELKLFSLFGRTEGDMMWKYNQYRDGSGSGWTSVLFFKTEQEAKEKVQEHLSSMDKIGEYEVKFAKEMGLEIPKTQLELYIKNLEEKSSKFVAARKEEIKKSKQDLKDARKIFIN